MPIAASALAKHSRHHVEATRTQAHGFLRVSLPLVAIDGVHVHQITRLVERSGVPDGMSEVRDRHW
eukprot:9060119-Lingulodinium_polyedra.AAC.1